MSEIEMINLGSHGNEIVYCYIEDHYVEFEARYEGRITDEIGLFDTQLNNFFRALEKSRGMKITIEKQGED